jgi:hypothetical protein
MRIACLRYADGLFYASPQPLSKGEGLKIIYFLNFTSKSSPLERI